MLMQAAIFKAAMRIALLCNDKISLLCNGKSGRGGKCLMAESKKDTVQTRLYCLQDHYAIAKIAMRFDMRQTTWLGPEYDDEPFQTMISLHIFTNMPTEKMSE